MWHVAAAGAMWCHSSTITIAALAWIGIASALPEDAESGCTSAACIWAKLRERGLVRDAGVVATRRTEKAYSSAGEPRQYYAYYQRPAYRQPTANYQSSHVEGKTVIRNLFELILVSAFDNLRDTLDTVVVHFIVLHYIVYYLS